MAHSCQSYPGTMVINYKIKKSVVTIHLWLPICCTQRILFYFSFFFYFFLLLLPIAILIGPSPTFLQHWAHPQNRSIEVLPITHLCSLFICLYAGSTLAKAYGIKVWCFGNILRKLFENLRNPLRTQWEPQKNNTSQWPYVLQVYEFPFVPHLGT